MGKKKSVTFEDDIPRIKKEKSFKADMAERQKHINNLLETKKELENKIKMAAHNKKKKSSSQEAPIPPPLVQEIVCCVPLCTNSSFRNKNKMFFPFPNIKKLSKQWVTNVGRKGFDKKGCEHLANNYKVCSDHFEPHMFVPKTKNKILISQAIPTIFESIHEPEISIHTPTIKDNELHVKKLPKRNRSRKKIIDDDDFDFEAFEDDEDLPLATLLPPKLSMKKRLVKKTDDRNKTKWMYKPSVQRIQDIDRDACQSSDSEVDGDDVEMEEGESVGDPNDENYNPEAKKKKMGSRKKPKEVLPLTMECYSDDLSPAQKLAYANATKIYEECKKKLDELAKMKNAKLVFNDKEISAYEIDEGISTSSEIEIEEEYPGMPVQKSTVMSSGTCKKGGQIVDKTKGGVGAAGSRKINTAHPVKPQESTSLGGLFSKVNKSNESGSTPDSKEVAFNKLAGKTYPSLVVIARPSLKLKDIPQSVIGTERTALDAKVKAVLLYTSNNLTEWLIQQGLLRSEQYCSVHQNTDKSPVKLKLGMYSDVAKFPHSGGYVWISECCPSKFVSVFYNSIFEGAPHTPSILVKLMYHWACQTSIGNVTSWVKIDNLYLKTFYSYMRCVCTAAVHEKHEIIGGPMKKVEVGVISLGTTNVDGNLRQVKVEVLGVFETDTTKIRLRAIEPLPESERNQKKRFAKIMEPLKEWVHPDSAICTDFTVDKSAFLALGFKNVFQVSLNDANPPQMNNKNIMEYLRRVVPRMFQNTLSLLSRHIIQQFLDELVWRERFGPIPSRAFESIVQHLAEQTKLDTGDTLLNRFQRISVNPFANWQYSKWSQNWPVSPVQEVKSSAPEKTPSEIVTSAVSTPTAESDADGKRGRKRPADKSPVRPAKKPTSSTSNYNIANSEADGDTSLETYYYGTLPGKTICGPKDEMNFTCPTCSQIFTNNLQLLVHLEVHSIIQDTENQDSTQNMCRYCLKSFTTVLVLNEHIDEAHLKKNIHCKCLICQEKCREKLTLVKHMLRSHNECELPYVCEYCEFRCSEHKRVVDHFYEEHNKDPVLQCPICLKVVVIGQSGKSIEKNIQFFLVHLQRHEKKIARKCTRCMLSFTNKMLIREHQLRDHGSYKDFDNFESYPDSGLMKIKTPSNTSLIPIPKLKLQTLSINYKFDRFDDDVKLNNNTINNDKNDLFCHECEVSMQAEDHFPGIFTCVHCVYSTCCINGMHDHTKSFHAGKDIEYNISKPTVLDTRMYCVCGFNSNSGNKLARHTAACKKISVYPTEESAEAAKVVVKGTSVLNILGLIRKDGEDDEEENIDKESAPVIEGEEGTDIDSAKVNGEDKTEIVEDANAPDTKTDDIADDTKSDETETSKIIQDDENDEGVKGNKEEEDLNEDKTEKEEDKIEKDGNIIDKDVMEDKSNPVPTTEGDSSNMSFDDVNQIGGEDLSNDGGDIIEKISAEKESELLEEPEESKETSLDVPKASEEDSIDDAISDSTSIDNAVRTVEDEESLLNSGDDSNNATSKLQEGGEISEHPSDVDSNEVDSSKATSELIPGAILETDGDILIDKSLTRTDTKDLPEATDNATFESADIGESCSTVPATFEGADLGKSSGGVTFEDSSSSLATSQKNDDESGQDGGSGGTLEEEEDDDDAELIKQDMAALQQDLAALSGTCDIPLNTILDRQLEQRPAHHVEVMETGSPPTTSLGLEKLDTTPSLESAMDVDEGKSEVTPSSTMDCDSSNTGDNMMME